MANSNNIQAIRTELEAGIQLPKCQKCACMGETLAALASLLPKVDTSAAQTLASDVKAWEAKMQSIKYACLGCEYCYPAVAQNAIPLAFPAAGQLSPLSCDFQVVNDDWPPVVGEYIVVDKTAPVAVSTLASVQLAEELAQCQPNGLAIVGKTETENIGLDKVVKNVIASPTLRYLIIAGTDPKGHLPGKTLLALAENGVNENRRVIGSPGKRPILRNVSVAEIRAFREQVQMIDMIGCDSPDEIGTRIEELSQTVSAGCGCGNCAERSSAISPATVSQVIATEPGDVVMVKLDKAGYFVIVPLADKGIITVEHYGYDNTLLRVVEGSNARAIYTTLLANGWITELSHAAYIGKELTKAELSIQHGFKYVQDGA